MAKNHKELDSILEFMLSADRLKEVDRTGWVISKVRDPEHVGDHSYSTAVLSYLLAVNMGLDAERCALMALYHDINEILTGDVATRYKESDQIMPPKLKKITERKNELKLTALLPGKERKKVRSLLDELYAQRSEEAKLVKQADKLDYIIQLELYKDKIKEDERAKEFFKTADRRIDMPEVRYLYEKVKAMVFKHRNMTEQD
ncbi:MAG: hypothetical protein BK997_00325 [Candidatus Micrarchaeum sp. ARMAN-1]|jgi:5'-deoxynucleotidase YfbR-like HD superfamily hydrolase|nr:MAG: hypothetical protein BK997_00325 [Candidatus Micrarchaeum sp. ARMAN-1]